MFAQSVRPLLPVLLAAVLVASPVTVKPEAEGIALGSADAQAEGFLEDLSGAMGRMFGAEPPPKRKVARAPAPLKNPPLPRSRPDPMPALELVVTGLSDQAVVALRSDLRVSDHRASALLETNVTRMVARPGLSLEAALERVRSLAPEAEVAVNARYAVSSREPEALTCETDCPAESGTPAALPSVATDVGSCPADVHIGLVAVRPDLNRPGFPIDAIDVLDSHVTTIDTAGQGLALLIAGDAERPALVPGAHLTVAPIDRSVDAFDLLARLDALADLPIDLVVLDVTGPANETVARAIDALADRNVPVVSPAGFSQGAMHADPAALAGTAARFGSLKASHSYLNVEGLEQLVSDPDRSALGCAGGQTAVAGLQ